MYDYKNNAMCIYSGIYIVINLFKNRLYYISE